MSNNLERTHSGRWVKDGERETKLEYLYTARHQKRSAIEAAGGRKIRLNERLGWRLDDRLGTRRDLELETLDRG